MDTTLNTTEFFWDAPTLQRFQDLWDNLPPQCKASAWLAKIHQGVRIPDGRRERAYERDVERLLKAARGGCQLQLKLEYEKISDKPTYQNCPVTWDALADAWDCISTAQLLVARSLGVFIDWEDSRDWDF